MKADPTYHDLGHHSEALRVEYDPKRIAYEELLEHFWASHDPTRRTASVQYRAALFVHDEEQRRLAEESRRELEERLGDRVVTEILPAGDFHAAEDYHQKWSLRRRGGRWLEWLRQVYPDPADLRDSTAAARLNGYLAGHRGGASAATLERDLGLSGEAAHELAGELGWE